MTSNLPADPRTSHRALALNDKQGLKTRYSDFLPEAQAIAEQDAAPLAKTLIFVVAALFGIFMLWAAFAEVEQVAAAPGVVRPTGNVKIVNHQTGGRITNLLVSEGDRVEKDQVLMEFDPEVARQEVTKRREEWQALAVTASRLEAEATGKPLKFDPQIAGARPDLIRVQRQLYRSRKASLGGRSGTSGDIIARRKRELASRRASLRTARRSLQTIGLQEKKVRELVNKGLYPELRYLNIRRQYDEAYGKVIEARESVGAAQSALAEERKRQSSNTSDWRSEVLAQLTEARSKRDKAHSAYLQGRAFLRNLSIRAPIAGIVKDLEVKGTGQSVRANEPLLKVVPQGAQLIIETRVSNADIGYITVGQEANVKVRTYDFIKFGTLRGKVEKVAADATVNNESGESWFAVTVRTDRGYLGSKPGQYPVSPGMESDVDLIIGRRSILSYMTDRLERTVQSSFRER